MKKRPATQGSLNSEGHHHVVNRDRDGCSSYRYVVAMAERLARRTPNYNNVGSSPD